ncbi:S-DNA-T family DNA segregation ATPase FtsK/SpoIIIE [Micromonospora polyrhachis]|uniref:S-DNA-T family DNA segregation ATPase FtsK/SpoIIIE n=2 Tax=Micromonospora polyrhachis TaxID=1282883 RepID=A0A7W7STV9_9ACTN|nr:S-DNA-T family DNA segregation ATPase FtsK/SpoIIIE [Micromonospora polyrhachis]
MPAPEYPTGELILDPPPEIPPAGGQRWAQMMMMLPMLAGSCAMALMFAGQGGSSLAYVTGGLFGVSALGMIFSQLSMSAGGQNRQQLITARRQFMQHLSQRRRTVRRTVTRQRAAQLHHHPDPDSLWSIAASPRLWERRSGEPDFVTVRIGLGPAELATPLVPPETKAVEDLDPLCAASLRRFLHTYAIVPDLPIVMALDGFSRVYLRGDGERTRALARALIAQAATFHAPDDLLVAVCLTEGNRSQWSWTKWLPHALHPGRTDGLGALRLVSTSISGLETMLDDVVAGRPRFDSRSPERHAQAGTATPHVLVLLDGGDGTGSGHLLTEGGRSGVTVLDLHSAPPRILDRHTLVLDVDAQGSLRTTTAEGTAEAGRADGLRPDVALALALQMAPIRLHGGTRTEPRMTGDVGLTELLGLGDPWTFDPGTTWVARSPRDRLRVPIGVGQDGGRVELDLKESAQDGMGPHGLLIGATGSGKSELLRTLVLALAVTHDPELLNFVLIDFKGGATFTRLETLPHTSAVITNLADELPLVDRMAEAINGELTRRQELLRASGNFVSQRDYERARASGAALAPLPSLLIVCDEFSELLSAKPDFVDMFVQIGRVGRSLGIHLLLASQRLEEGRLRGLDTHLSYRIGLRTFSAAESRVVLGDAAAYELPRSPGHGFLRFATEALARFRAAYVSGALPDPAAGTSHVVPVDQVRVYHTEYLAPALPTPEAEEPAPVDEVDGESLLDVLVDRMRGRGAPAHQVWLPPLTDPPTLDNLLPPIRVVPGRGLTVADDRLHGALRAQLGVVDRPSQQRRDPLWLDLGGAAGHVVIVGGPHSGKSMALRTFVVGMTLCHTPREVQFYCLDFGGGGLLGLRELPHVGGVATRLEASQVRRTVAEVRLLLEQRERLFAEHGIDSMASYRRARAAGRFPEDPFGDVFVVVDGWGTLRSEFDDIETALVEVGNRGLSYGVHLVVSATRWLDLRPAVRDIFGSRLEFRLGEPGDSALDRRTAMNVPEKVPGRGITPERLHFLAALPRMDGRQDAETASEGQAALIRQIREGWTGPSAPPVRLLPTLLPYEELPVEADRPGVPVGIAELDLRPVTIDFETDAHFIVYGDSGSGKTGFLRLLARSLAERNTPRQARLIVVDYRRGLLGSVPDSHLVGYGTSAAVTRNIIEEVATAMRARLPGPDVTAEQLRDRSWWQGSQLYVLVDDYDLVAGAQNNPLAPLGEFLAQAEDIGLHLIVARRTAGAARGAYEQVQLQLRELGVPGILMSGAADEGPLLGNVRPSAQPPGRGWLVDRRHGPRLVQLAWRSPS